MGTSLTKSVLKAMRQRAARSNMTVIRELVLENLQNRPLPKILTEQLTELTISAQNCWGAIPGEFNGKGLQFPRLKTLTLAEYVIARHDQFDWVLAQESLTCLRLHSCAICSHILVLQPEFASWGVDSRAWKRVADPPDGEDGSSGTSYTIHPGECPLTPGFYVNSLRWETVFDSIRENLPRLHEFSFTKEEWRTFFRHRGCGNAQALAEALANRYLAFSQYWSELWTDTVQRCNYVEEDRQGRPEELLALTEEADGRALKRLLRTTRERRIMVKTAQPKSSASRRGMPTSSPLRNLEAD